MSKIKQGERSRFGRRPISPTTPGMGITRAELGARVHERPAGREKHVSRQHEEEKIARGRTLSLELAVKRSLADRESGTASIRHAYVSGDTVVCCLISFCATLYHPQVSKRRPAPRQGALAVGGKLGDRIERDR